MDSIQPLLNAAKQTGLSFTAIRRISQQYNLANFVAEWQKENYGVLRASDTGDDIGPATREQAILSYEESHEGHVSVRLCAYNGKERGVVEAYVVM